MARTTQVKILPTPSSTHLFYHHKTGVWTLWPAPSHYNHSITAQRAAAVQPLRRKIEPEEFIRRSHCHSEAMA
jgi:hypothetical protein